MVKKLTLTGVVLLTFVVLQKSASAELTYSSSVDWKKAEKHHYLVSKRKFKSMQGKDDQEISSETDISVEVLDVRDRRYSIGWTFGETRVAGVAPERDQFAVAMANLANGLTLVLDVAEEGTFRDLQNWQEAKQKIHRAIDELASQITEKDDFTLEQAAQFKQKMLSSYQSKQQIIQLISLEAAMFFQAQGKDYSSEKYLQYMDSIPNPFGGEPFPALGWFALAAIDRQKKIAKISWQQSLDGDAVERILTETFVGISKQMGKPAPTADEIPDIQIDDLAEFDLYMETGWPAIVSHTRTSRMLGGTQTDVMIIEKQ